MRKNWTTTLTSRFYGMLFVAALALSPAYVMAANSVDPASTNHVLGSSIDLAITLTEDDGTFSALTSDGTVSNLVQDTHYELTDGTNFTILASYLNAQSTGDVEFVFGMTNGVSPTSTVTIAAGDATVSTGGSHTLGTTNTLDITLTPNGRSFTNLYDGVSSLVDPTDYTETNNVYTITAVYLNSLSTGTNTLTFQMDDGTDPEADIIISAGNASLSTNSATHTLGSTNDLDAVTLTLNGRTLNAITRGATPLSTNDYDETSNDYTILASYLNTLSTGTNTLTFDMNAGTAPALAIVVSAGNATVSPTNDAYTLGTTNTIEITLTANGNTFTNLHDGARSLETPADYTVSSGVYTLKATYLDSLTPGTNTLTFQMSAGDDPETEIVISAGNASVNPETASHTLGTFGDIEITLDPNGRSETNLFDGASSLTVVDDYTETNNVYTLKAAYLNTLTTGTNTLTFQMDDGTDPEVDLVISAGNATVSPPTGSYALGSTNTLTFTVTENGRGFTDINNGTTNLTPTTHYTWVGNVYTILPAYLNAQSLGAHPLTFVMNGGSNPSATANIQAGNATVTPASYTHALASTNDRTYTLTLNGRTLSDVKNVSTVLSTPAHYTVSGGTNVTIKATYINTLAAGSTVTFTFDVSGGTDPTAQVNILTGDPTVSPTAHPYALGSGLDLPVTITPRGTTFVALMTNDVALVSPADYAINGNVCTIKAAFLETLTLGTVIDLEFDMSAGTSPTTTVTIVEGDATVSPETASYERGSGDDIALTLTHNGRTLVNILNDTNVLMVASNDYTFADNIYTITSAYLEKQAAGNVTLTFDMDGGNAPDAVIAVSQSSVATLTSVLTETDLNPNGGDGNTTGTAIAWDVDLDHNIDSLARSNIVVATHATFTVTTNSNYTSNLLGEEDSQALTVGQNIVYIKVTAEDTTAKFYKVELWRAASDATTLVSMLDQSTTNTTGNGTIAVPYAVEITVGYYTNAIATSNIVVASDASFRFYTNSTYSSFDEITGTNTMSLSQGVTNQAYVKVIAQDNTAVAYYNVGVVREAGDSSASLTNVLGQAFTSGGGVGSIGDPFTNTITVAFSETSLALSDILIDGLDATRKLYSNSGFDQDEDLPISLSAGDNHAYIKVTPQDTSINYFYDVTITRSAASDDAGLETVLLKAITTTSGTGADTNTPYVAGIEVRYAVTNLTLSDIVASNAPYSVVHLYSASNFTDNADAPIALVQDGVTNAYITVTSESGSITNYYAIDITNLPPVGDADLVNVLGDTGSSVAGGDGTNIAARTTWTFTTPFLTNTLTSADIEVDSLATFQLFTNVNYTDGETNSIALTEDATNRVYIKVTAEDTTTNKFYEAVIFRTRGNTNAALTSVLGQPDSNPILQDGTSTNTPILWGQRIGGSPLQVAYSNDVVGTNDIIIGEALLSSFNLYTDPSFSDAVTSSNTIALLPGVATNIYIKVTPQSEIAPRSRYYDVRIERNAGETDADLASVLDETDGSPSGAGTFSAPYLWAISVSNDVDTVGLTNIVVATNTATAALYEEAFIEDSRVTGENTIALEVPTTVVYVKVTAMDPEVEQFYAITVARAASTDAGLISVLEQTPTFSGIGTNAASPMAGPLTIPYTTTTVGTNDIVSADESAFALFSDSDFQDRVTTETIDIGIETAPIYVRVTAEDGTTIRYYSVTLTREGGLQVSPATLTYTSIPGYNPPPQEITLTNSSTNDAISVTNVTTYSANSGTTWFSLGTNTFALAGGEAVSATGAINVTNLAVGTYTATNTFTDAANIPWQTVVTLDITAAADNEIFFSGLIQDYTGTNIAVGVTCRSGDTNIVVTYEGSNSLPVNVGTYAVTASVATVGNWFATTNDATLQIVPATQVITFEGTNVVYDGTAKAVTATALLGTNAVVITYNGNAYAPTNAGTYAVTGTVVAGHSWLAGTNTTTLTIDQAPQTIVEFSLPSTAQMNELIPLSGSVSPAGSPALVTYEVVGSGPGSIDGGNNLTFTGGGSVTVRASAAATDNYLAATSVDATVEVIDFAMDAVDESFGSAHNGLHTLKFSPDGDLYMFYSATNGAMNVSKQADGEEAFGSPALVGAASGSTLLRSPMDMLFGDTTNMVGQSGTLALLADMTNGTVSSFANTAAVGLRNSRFLTGTAPTNYLFVNSGSSRVIACTTTNDWATHTSKDIGSGILTGAAREGDTIAVFTSAGVLLSANAGTTYSSAGTPAAAMASGGDWAWYAVNLRTVNQATYMDVYSNRKLLSDSIWKDEWDLVKTFETANDTVSHPRLTAYENIAILTWQQGDTGKLMYTVTQNHGATWTDVKELVSAPTYVRQSSLEAGYDVAVHQDNDGVRFVAAAGLDYDAVDLSGITLRATALQTNVYLRWTQPTSLGAPSDEVLIRYLAGTNTYPTLSLGTTLYQGSEQLAIHGSVIQDQTYMYQLWVRSGASFVDPNAFSGAKEITMFEWNYGLPSATLSPASAEYTKNSGTPPAFTVTLNGRLVNNVTSTGTGTLTPVVSGGNVYTIPESYLTNQTAGTTLTLTFEMNGGDNLSATIAVLDSATVNPIAPEFELGSSTGLAITLTPNGRTLQSIMNGVNTLTPEVDYTVISGTNITILASYLNAQVLGETTLDFVMDGGTNPQSVITVVGGATVSPTTYRHTLGTDTALAITMTSRGRALTNLTDGASLTVVDDYTVVSSNASYSILPAYLNSLATDTTLTFEMSDGVDPQTLIKLASGNTEVAEVSGSHTLGSNTTVTLTLDLNGRTFDALTDGTQVLDDPADYTASVTDGVLTVILTADYLNSFEPGTVNLEFNMDAGQDPSAEVTILPGTASVAAQGDSSHVLGAGAAESYALTRNGRSLLSLKNGLNVLEAGVDYTVDNSDPQIPVYTVSTNYLNTLPVGTATLTFDMLSGTDLPVQITVTEGNATVSPETTSYNVTSTDDLVIALTLNGRSLTKITNTTDTEDLILTTHYTVNITNPLVPVYTIKASYLDLLGENVDKTLTFDMNVGNDPTTVITVSGN